ncbi:hypothetical protein [Streptomyces sp. 2A115]|uniref:hypothetical protein n=1 Tax=Streptomyces sp. 2A115 TaxID=3457439 RepID=UPI003FD1FA14
MTRSRHEKRQEKRHEDKHQDGRGDMREDVGRDMADEPSAGLPGGFALVPSQREIGSVIAATAASNLALAGRRAPQRRSARPGGAPGTATDRRSH